MTMRGTVSSCWQLEKLPDADAILIGQQTSFTTQAAGITLFHILPQPPRTSSSDPEYRSHPRTMILICSDKLHSTTEFDPV